jgi:Cu/Ag efflux protein CusF
MIKKITLLVIVTMVSFGCQQANEQVKNIPTKPSQGIPAAQNSSNTVGQKTDVSATSNAQGSLNSNTITLSNTNTSVRDTKEQNEPINSKAKYFDGKGVVTKINLELVSVELDHEEIKGLMPKMIMEFYVKEKTQLEKLKVGDKVDFVLEENGGAEIITEIKKTDK